MSPQLQEKNLLLAFLALQMDFISREQFLGAMQVWVADKSKSLADILADQRTLSEDLRRLLAALVEKHLARHDNDLEKSLAAISSVPDVRGELTKLGDADVDRTISLIGLTSREPSRLSSPAAEPSDPSARFRIIRLHARGGLGEVFVARDAELHRDVALKQIQERFAQDASSRTRFLQEAEITGGLEHPGIVPVYGLGSYADGRPFYAMRFIQGDSLKDAIERFHDLKTGISDAGAPEGARRLGLNHAPRALELRKLLARFIDVCNAIAYAHSREVLHRDLKPGNIMLGKFGETLVVDWGLAKPLRAPEDDTTLPPKLDPPLVPTSQPASAATVQGTAVGTPGYMSPEQAMGRLDLLGPASDVYCLGATLFTVLTGRPPHVGKNSTDILKRVASGEIPRPRTLVPDVPVPLEAICLKALAWKPEQRYATALALAEDLEHYLADEAIAAKQDSFVERSHRLVRRHRGVALTTAASLIVLAIGATIAAAWINGQRQVAEEQKQKAVQLSGEMTKLADKESKARVTAEEQTRLAQERLARIERGNYAARLALVSAKIDSDPSASLSLLEDELACPPKARDFVWGFYHRLARRDQVAWAGHGDKVTFAAFMPSSAGPLSLCTAGLDGQVKLWRCADQKLLHSIETGAPVTCGAILPDGVTIATGDKKGKVTLWNSTDRASRSVQLWDGPINDLTVARDGSLLAGCGTRDVAVVNLMTLKTVQRHTVHDAFLWSVAFRPDGQMLVAAGSGEEPTTGCLRIYSGKNFATIVQAPVVTLGAFCKVAPLGSSNKMLLFSTTGGVISFDLYSLEFERNRLPTTSTGLALAVTADGKEFATSTKRAMVASSNGAIPPRLYGQGDRTSSFTQSADEGRFRPVTFWNAHGVTIRSHLPGVNDHAHRIGESDDVTALAYAPDGRLLVTGSERGRVAIYDHRPVRERATLMPGKDQVGEVVFSADGNRLTAYAGGEQATWDIRTLEQVPTPDLQPPKPDAAEQRFLVEQVLEGDRVTAVKLHPLGNAEGKAVVLEDSQGVAGTEVSPDGEFIAARRTGPNQQESIDIWSTSTGKRHFLYGVPAIEKARMIWADTKRLVESGQDAEGIVITQVNAATKSGVSQRVPGVTYDSVVPPLLSPDSKLVAISHGDDTGLKAPKPIGEIVLWDVAAAKVRARLIGHRSSIWSLAFSPDSRVLASGGFDYSVRIWDTTVGIELVNLPGHRSTVLALAFSPDGKTLASGSFDQTVKLWAAPSAEESLLPRALLGTDSLPFGQQEENEDGQHPWHQSLAQLLQFKTQITERGQLADDNPDNLNYRRTAATMWAALSQMEGGLGLSEACIESMHQAIRHFAALDAKGALDDKLRADQAQAIMNLGDRLRFVGLITEAQEFNQRAVDVWRELVKKDPEQPQWQSQLGGSLNNLAMSKLAGGDVAEARTLLAEAITFQTKARTANPQVPQYTRFLTNHYLVLADAELEAGQIPEMLAALEKARELFGPAANSHLGLAQTCSKGVQFLESAQNKNSPEDTAALNKRLLAMAVQSLEKAKAAGFKNWDGLQRDPSFQALLGTEEGKKFLQTVTKAME